MDEYPRLRIAGIEPESFVDGPGIRMTIFTQGCHHNCPGCQNPQTHDFNGGHFIDIEEILSMIDENPLLDGITFSGGDPMDQAAALIPLAREIKERGMNLIIYTGYTYERLMELSASRPGFFELLSFADILAWCFPLVVIVASAIGFGFAAYYWGRNARIENYLRRRKEEADRTLRQNQPN